LLSLCKGLDSSGNKIQGISPEEYENYFFMRKEFYNLFYDFMDSSDFYLKDDEKQNDRKKVGKQLHEIQTPRKRPLGRGSKNSLYGAPRRVLR
ncbi:MAG: hypothetical protein SPJ12_08775, partial [Duodenibacillus sp.]|nr:hypothetical protein [Duodenibacillus sp.]